MAALDALSAFAVATQPCAAPPGCSFCRPAFAAAAASVNRAAPTGAVPGWEWRRGGATEGTKDQPGCKWGGGGFEGRQTYLAGRSATLFVVARLTRFLNEALQSLSPIPPPSLVGARYTLCPASMACPQSGHVFPPAGESLSFVIVAIIAMCAGWGRPATTAAPGGALEPAVAVQPR